MDIDELCDKNNKESLYSLLGKSHNAYPPMFIRRFQQVVHGRDIDYVEICTVHAAFFIFWGGRDLMVSDLAL